MLESQFEIQLVCNLEDHQLMHYEFLASAGLGPAGVSIVLISQVIAFFSYTNANALTYNHIINITNAVFCHHERKWLRECTVAYTPIFDIFVLLKPENHVYNLY